MSNLHDDIGNIDNLDAMIAGGAFDQEQRIDDEFYQQYLDAMEEQYEDRRVARFERLFEEEF